MGRPSLVEKRRTEIVHAFALVLADHGYAGATVAAVAERAGVAPGLVHHYFETKQELLSQLVRDLLARFRSRVAAAAGSSRRDRLGAYVDGAVRLDAGADVVAARCWVSIFAEATRDPVLFAQLRRMVDVEIESIHERSEGQLSVHDSGAVLAFILGSLVLGSFAPRKTAGFAAPALHRFIAAAGGSTR